MRIKDLIKALVLTGALVITSCQFQEESVQIGNQVWMAKNLNVSTFRNGDPILEAKTRQEWLEAGRKEIPAWCYYENDPANGARYGKLYNWYAVNDPRGLAPEGWHVPSDAEWSQLVEFLGDADTVGQKLKSSTGWAKNSNGKNEIKFDGRPGGWRSIGGIFFDENENAFWWTSTEYKPDSAWKRSLSSHHQEVSRAPFYKYVGLSVRCIKE